MDQFTLHNVLADIAHMLASKRKQETYIFVSEFAARQSHHFQKDEHNTQSNATLSKLACYKKSLVRHFRKLTENTTSILLNLFVKLIYFILHNNKRFSTDVASPKLWWTKNRNHVIEIFIPVDLFSVVL